MTVKIAETSWHPEMKLVVTQICGEIEKNDVEQWEKSLKETLDKIEDDTAFKIFVNMHGFTAVNIEAHKRFRGIIPSILADYSWRVGYVDIFEEAKTMVFRNTRGIKCLGAAHSHQDKTKMDQYEIKFGSDRERFFADPVEAKQWIEKLEIES